MTLLVGLALMGLVGAAQAQQSETQMLRETVKQLQDQLKAVMDRLQQLEAKEATRETAPAPAPVAVVPAAPKSSWADKLCISGYIQPQYISLANADDRFTLRRMYLNVQANVSPKSTAVVQFERVTPIGEVSDRTVTLSSCFLDYKFNDLWSVMFGQVPSSYGWDTAESSSRRLPLERFAASEGFGAFEGRPAVTGFWFLGPWDRGFYVTRKANGSEPTLIAGLINGNFTTNDNNQNKPYEIDLKWKRGINYYGVSWFDGTYTTPGTNVTTERRSYDLSFHRDPCPWGFQAEYLDGVLFDRDMDGWYGQVAYNKRGGKATPYVRYEQYDQDKSASGDTYMALHAGIAYQLDKWNELTLQLTDASVGCTNLDYSGLQWQMGF